MGIVTLEVDLKKLVKAYIFLLLFAGTIIALDVWTKTIVRGNLGIGEMWSPWGWLTPYARIVHWYNTGVAFGLFQDANMFFIVLAIIVSSAIILYYSQVPEEEWPLRIALSMQLAGAVGNLISRIQVGHVTDFISVGSFPVFNVADSSITVGVAVLIIGIWLQDRKEKQAENQPSGIELNEERPSKETIN